MVPTRTAVKLLGIHASTLRRWADEGKIKYVRTPTGQRLYDTDSIMRGPQDRKRYIYCRVSSRNQKDDLQRQIEYTRTRYPSHELIEDIASGLNFKRKGFLRLLDETVSGAVEEIVIAHKDRLCRFGFDLWLYLAGKHHTRIVVLDDTSLSPQDELVRDLISIIHVFSCRIYGLRKYTSKISQDPSLPQKAQLAALEEISGAESLVVQ